MLVPLPPTLAPRGRGAWFHWEKADFLLGLQTDISGGDRQGLVVWSDRNVAIGWTTGTGPRDRDRAKGPTLGPTLFFYLLWGSRSPHQPPSSLL